MKSRFKFNLLIILLIFFGSIVIFPWTSVLAQSPLDSNISDNISNEDEKHILEILNKSFEAMKNDDIVAFLDCYTTDNSVLKEIGGRESIIRNMMGTKKTLTRYENIEIKFRRSSSTPGLEAMLGDATITLRETTESLWWYGFIQKEVHPRRIYSFKKDNGRWKIYLIMDHSTGEEYFNDPEVVLESALKKFSSGELTNIIYSLGRDRGKDINDIKARAWPILDTLISDFRKVIELKPSSTEGYYWIAALSTIKGDHAEAVDNLKKAIEISQDDAKIDYKLGNHFYRAMLHCSLGQIYLRQNRPEEALNEFKIAIGQNPEYSQAYSFISKIYQTKGDIEAARSNRLNAFKYNPLFRMEPLYLNSKNKKAQELFLQAILNNQGEAFLKQAIELDGDFISAYYYLGLIYFKNGDWQKAIECMNKVIALDPGQEDPYWELGAIYGGIYSSQGETAALDSSMQNFEKAIKLNPYIHELYASLALSYFSKGNFDKAIEIIKEAKALCPNYPRVNFYMAMFLKKKLDSDVTIPPKERSEIYNEQIIPLLRLALDFCTDDNLRKEIELFYKFVKQ